MRLVILREIFNFCVKCSVKNKYSFNNIPNFKLLRAAGLLNKNGTLSLLLESPEGKTELLKCKCISQVTPDNSCYLLHNAVAPVYINMTKNTVAASYGDLSKKLIIFRLLVLMNIELIILQSV